MGDSHEEDREGEGQGKSSKHDGDCDDGDDDETNSKNIFEKAQPSTAIILTEIPKNDLEEYYYYSCYYCDSFKTNSKGDYESHVINKHGPYGAIADGSSSSCYCCQQK